MSAPVGFGQALAFWLKLGFISFGGPAGQIALMHQELVERRRWISEARFLHALNYCMLLPGPEAQQLATYIGWLLHRTWGGVAAGLLFILPSLFILVGLSWVYLVWGQLPLVAGVLEGIKPAVTAIVLAAAHRIGSRVLHNGFLWSIAVAAFVGIALLKLPFPLIVLLAAVAGWSASRLRPAWVLQPSDHSTGAAPSAAVAAAASTLEPSADWHATSAGHTRFHAGRLLRVLLVFGLLWSLSLGALVLAFGWQGTLAQMGWFFTKAALLTFGGAYAVLPYVYQGAVEQQQWLSAAQMIDGLALGETTPGPLIMVVAFVGFVGGWARDLLPALGPFWGGAFAALVATWFTFLPSFLFILAGAPLVESTHGRLSFTAPLTAITAAVVGVVVNLAVFFAGHVLWPQGLEGGFDARALMIGLLAAYLLLVRKRGVVEVIGLCAAIGAVRVWAAMLLP